MVNDDLVQRRLAERITRARFLANLRQEDIARKVGVSTTTVKNWEAGRYSVSGPNLARLASALGMSLVQLLEGLESEDYDEEEWALDVEYAMLSPRMKEKVIREAMDEQNRRIDRTRDNLAVSFGAREMALV